MCHQCVKSWPVIFCKVGMEQVEEGETGLLGLKFWDCQSMEERKFMEAQKGSVTCPRSKQLLSCRGKI